MRVILITLFMVNLLFANIGTISFLSGKGSISRGTDSLQAAVGLELEKYDIVTTEKNSKIKITFVDNTLVTIGKESALNIEDYVYDTKTPENSKTKLNFLKVLLNQ